MRAAAVPTVDEGESPIRQLLGTRWPMVLVEPQPAGRSASCWSGMARVPGAAIKIDLLLFLITS